MPKVSDSFSAYPVSVVLDGAGNGTVSFQATGDNIAITKIFGKVAPVGAVQAQAVATIYKGQVGDNFAVDNSNSGSTGFSATGTIGLMDGEIVYVRWVGGDPGAVATATFSGKKIPFDQTSVLDFAVSQPFAAGDGTIIFPALQSANFVTGVSGWKLSRNGDIEAANITARGTFLIPGPNGTYIFAYVATVTTPAGVATIPVIDFQGDDAGASPGSIYVYTDGGYSLLGLNSPVFGADQPARVELRSSTTGDPTTAVIIDATSLVVGGNIVWGAFGSPAVTVDANDTSVTNGTTTSTTFVNTLTTSGIRGVVFIAPPSGKVAITVSSGGFNNTIGQYTLTDFEVRVGGAVIGAGALVRASDENTASQFQSVAVNQAGQHSVTGLVSGLTPGATYNTSITCRVTANTGTWNRRTIMCVPVM